MTVKNHMKIYLNAGDDVDDAEQMKNAMETSDGSQYVRVVLCRQDSGLGTCQLSGCDNYQQL